MNELKRLEQAIAQWAEHATLDVDKYVNMLREFYAECPHADAALAYLIQEASLELAARTDAKRLPINDMIDAAVKMNTDRILATREVNKKKKEGN